MIIIRISSFYLWGVAVRDPFLPFDGHSCVGMTTMRSTRTNRESSQRSTLSSTTLASMKNNKCKRTIIATQQPSPSSRSIKQGMILEKISAPTIKTSRSILNISHIVLLKLDPSHTNRVSMCSVKA